MRVAQLAPSHAPIRAAQKKIEHHISVREHVCERDVLRPKHECGCDDDQAGRFVEDDCFEWRKSKQHSARVVVETQRLRAR